MVVVCVVCFVAFLAWIFSLLRICMQRKENVHKTADQKEENVELALAKNDRNCTERPSLFTPTTNYEGNLSIHTAWSQGRSSVN